MINTFRLPIFLLSNFTFPIFLPANRWTACDRMKAWSKELGVGSGEESRSRRRSLSLFSLAFGYAGNLLAETFATVIDRRYRVGIMRILSGIQPSGALHIGN